MRLDTYRHFDFWLFGTVLVLIIFSIAMINSAIAGNIELIESNTVGRQILFAGIDFVVILIATAMDYHLWIVLGRILYVLLAIDLGANSGLLGKLSRLMRPGGN